MKRWGWAAAASVAVLLVSVGYYYSHRVNTVKRPPVASAILPADVKPGHNGAVLTLGNGNQIVLDSLHNGVIAVQNGAKIVLDNDQVAYRSADVEKVSYNTMTTPNGRQYSLVLDDGTKVWLNAASSITYPTAFRGNDRRVQMTGEAYFEVAKDSKKPFRIEVNHTVVEVLGTHFNVNAYTDESTVRTTLLEGSVRVEKGNRNSTIVPGQQAEISDSSGKIDIVDDVDLEAVVAWKNGYFSFQNAGLTQIMREISRWYDVEVVYQSADTGITFSGDLGRNLTLNQVLSALHEMNIHYKIEANKLIIKR
jgi:archaellum component FlaF (FlaF/FlaG flagellin family)